LPSYREGFGSIVIDAAAAGVPAIGSNIAGLVDSIEDGNTGILVPAGDVTRLAETMLSMLESPERCRQMGAAARSRAEKFFTADKLYASLKDFYLAQLAAKGRF
jgi:glycosyltransferase involved in cell wall biosynthesis